MVQILTSVTLLTSRDLT